jgi:hypothetical protein
MPKNRSSRSKKLTRQAKARTSRSLPPVPRLVASPAEARSALERVAIDGHFQMAGPEGQTHTVTFQAISDWHNASYAANGEPPLELGELSEILMHDFMFGRLRLRTDGLWESDADYFAGSPA